MHFMHTILLGILPLWPENAHTLPLYVILKGFVDEYISKSNDTYMLAVWRQLPHEWEFAHYRAFFWIEM